jgi:hypothetical protein
MTQSPKSDRAATKRREKEWLTAQRCRQEQLQALPDRDLDALVAIAVFNNLDLTAVPFSTSWEGFGRIVDHMRENGYTLSCHSFEPSHLEWMKQFPSTGDTRPAEVTVVDIHHRLSVPATIPNLSVYSDTLPRAAAIAAVLTRQMQQETCTSPPPPPEVDSPRSGWTEERRQRHSEQMKGYWQRKNAAGPVSKEAV